jgi:predicted DNA-binding antitoxin AbrB/MazE fold protein
MCYSIADLEGSVMTRTVEAIYRNGVLTPLEPLDLPDDARVLLDVHLRQSDLAAWQAVYADLSPEDVAAIEGIAGDRSRFMPPSR